MIHQHEHAKPSALQRFRARILRTIRAEDGVASLEFVLAIPVILAVFMASMESGVLMTRFIMLEQSVDVVMRKLRLGQYPNPDSDLLKEEICKHTVIMNSCREAISIEMMPISTTSWAMPTNSMGCVDRENNVQPALTFDPGAAHEVMLVRVCVAQDALFPTTGIGLKLPKDSQGGYGLVAVSAFVNEP
ncbi:TadE/TadG family type IV pilus assembly protein [Pseudorhodobacter aquimaris]|uniref:TadE/TadG family type IV pilus assembly protein n=1 Tax=Pseudorhodobacter aquimaris TaxID=687412 RepID=UPI000AE7DA9A|nr:pilus assembly protein [Pseudorhodobacter aquimaris]